MTYEQDLAKVGLHPDNPDSMYSELQKFLQNPQAFKNADKNWRGAKDNLSSWEEPKGKQTLMWPFHGGKWLDNFPKNDAQIRAVYKIPFGTPTGTFLARVYKFPVARPYRIRAEEWKQSSNNPFDSAWSAVQQGVGTVAGIADTLKIPGANLYASLLTGQDPIAALKKDLANFTDSAAIAKGVASGDMGPLKAAIGSGAAKFGVNLPPEYLNAAAQAYASGDVKAAAVAAMGPDYTQAWKVATNNGNLFDAALPAPPGLSYAQTAVPAQATNLNNHPAIVAATKVPLSVTLAATPLKTELHPEVKALVVAKTGVDPALLIAKKNPWWKIGGAAGGATAGALVGGPPGAIIGGAVGYALGLLKTK